MRFVPLLKRTQVLRGHVDGETYAGPRYPELAVSTPTVGQDGVRARQAPEAFPRLPPIQ
jgi:hypothetical protein